VDLGFETGPSSRREKKEKRNLEPQLLKKLENDTEVRQSLWVLIYYQGEGSAAGGGKERE